MTMLRAEESAIRAWSHPVSSSEAPFDRLVTFKIPESGINMVRIEIRGETVWAELDNLKRAVDGLDEWRPEKPDEMAQRSK